MIILVRHGRTLSNAAGLLLGRADPPLDDTGVAQARAVAATLAGSDISRVIASPLTRARQTAEAIVGGRSEIVIDERWIELDYGDLDGTPLTDVDDDTWARWRSDSDFSPAGGETLAELGRRVRSACDELVSSFGPRDNVVVVSHVSPIKAAAAWALGAGDDMTWRLFVEPGSIGRIGIGERGPHLRTWNEVPSRP
jgi:broad specificity phosphatase PhoE